MNSLSIISGNVISIVASFSKEQGKILNYSERTPSFFGYTMNEFSNIVSVKELMPSVIAKNHDHFVKRLINSGDPHILRRYRLAVAKDKAGFVFPINIYINYFFNNASEFCFSSLIIKIQTPSYYIVIDDFYNIKELSLNFLNFLKCLQS